MSKLSLETCNPQAFGTRHSLTPLQIACKNGGTVALIPPYEKRCNGHLDIVKLILGRIGETLPKNKENFKKTDFETFNLAFISPLMISFFLGPSSFDLGLPLSKFPFGEFFLPYIFVLFG